MFANKDIILRKMALKGVRVYDIYLDSGCNRKVYTAFETNLFTKNILKLIVAWVDTNARANVDVFFSK